MTAAAACIEVPVHEERVGGVQCERFQVAQMRLAARGHPNLGAGVDQSVHAEDAQAVLRGQTRCLRHGVAFYGDEEINRDGTDL